MFIKDRGENGQKMDRGKSTSFVDREGNVGN